MKIDDLLKHKSEWLKGAGPKSHIAISTRIRLARNLEGHKYFTHADDNNRENTFNTILFALKKCPFLKDAFFMNMNDLAGLDKIFLVERHLMSREHAIDVKYKGLVVDEKEIVSAMINEEDHLRLQVLQSGFNIKDTWRIADEIDSDLEKYLSFDYSNKFGYLTSCPTNTGTGLRASVMLHLSALALTGQIENVFDAISKLGLTMRGFYGEGTEGLGDFFQISNQVALGRSELDILENLEGIIKRIISREESTRMELLTKKKQEITDRIYRSYGTLKSARIITSNETIKLLSSIRLGIDMGIIEDIDIPGINEVMLFTQPAHMQKLIGSEIAHSERDIKRADLIRKKLGVESE